MTDWDKKLAKIVAETERHLASVRSHLRSSGSQSTPPYRTSYNTLTSHRRNSITPPPSILRSSESGHGSLFLSSGLTSPPKRNVSFESSMALPSSSSSSLTLLSEKIRKQQRDVNGLRDSVEGVHSSLKQQQEQLRSLREELQLSRLQLEEDGGSIKVDRKIHKLREELSREVEQLKKKVQLCLQGKDRGSHASCGKVLTSVTNDFCEFKLQTDQRLIELQQEVSGLRADFVRQEARLSRACSGLKDLEKTQEKSSKVLHEVKGHLSGAGAGRSKVDRSIADLSSDVRRFKQLLGGLELRLGHLEDARFSSVLTKTSHVLSSSAPYSATLGASESREEDDRSSVGRNEVSSHSSVRSRSRSSKGNPLHAQLGKPLIVGIGLPQKYLEKSGDVSETVMSVDVDDYSSLTGWDVEEEEAELEGSLGGQEDLSLSALDLSELEDSTFNDVDESILETDGTLSAGSQ